MKCNVLIRIKSLRYTYCNSVGTSGDHNHMSSLSGGLGYNFSAYWLVEKQILDTVPVSPKLTVNPPAPYVSHNSDSHLRPAYRRPTQVHMYKMSI